MSELTVEELKYFAIYDPETGIFTARIATGWRNSRVAGRQMGSINDRGYVSMSIRRKHFYAHRLAWLYVYGKWPDDHIDHINGDRADNRIANLRDVPNSINCENRRTARPDNKSTGVLGVTYDKKRRKFCAAISIHKKRYGLGRYDTVEEASNAYLQAKRRFHVGCTI